MRELWGALLCGKMLLSFGKCNEEGTELSWKPVFVGAEHLRTWAVNGWVVKHKQLSSEMLYQYYDGDEASMEGAKCRVEVPLCPGGLFWRISSHSNKHTISQHLSVRTDKHWEALRASARSSHRGRSWSAALGAKGTWRGSSAAVSRQSELRTHKELYLQLNIKIFVSVREFNLTLLNEIFHLN